MVRTRFSLIVEIGEPHKTGCEIPMSDGSHLLGRPFKNHHPEIPFTSLYVSKRHALITAQDGRVHIKDLQSKHGTHINSNELIPDEDYLLKPNDVISLAKGAVQVRFVEYYDAESEGTIDFNTAQMLKNMGQQSLKIDPERREAYADGCKLHLHGKEMDLLLLLYNNRHRAVSYDEIRLVVWPERPPETNNVPGVGNDEISALIYRLRKRLGDYSTSITSVPRYGYRLDI